MELFVNETKIDIQLEDEKTVGDVLTAFEKELEKENATIININLDGKTIFPDEIDNILQKELEANTIIKLEVISQNQIEQSFSVQKELSSTLAEEIKTLSVKFISGKDKEANSIIAKLADLIDSLCHTASLSALFPQKFGNLRIEGKTFPEFFKDFSEILRDFENAFESKDTVLMGDLGEYEISPRLIQLANSLNF